MAEVAFRDSSNADKYFGVEGAGTLGDPHIAKSSVTKSVYAAVFGADVPTQGVAIGLKSPTSKLRALLGDESGNLYAKLIASSDTDIGSVKILGVPTVALTSGQSLAIASALPYGTNLIGATMDAGFIGGANGTTPIVKREFKTSGANSWYDITDVPSAGKTQFVTDIWISTDTAGEIQLKWENAAGDYAGATKIFAGGFFPANNGIDKSIVRGMLWAPAADLKLMIKHEQSGAKVTTTTFAFWV